MKRTYLIVYPGGQFHCGLIGPIASNAAAAIRFPTIKAAFMELREQFGGDLRGKMEVVPADWYLPPEALRDAQP